LKMQALLEKSEAGETIPQEDLYDAVPKVFR
jgi:hypothetical protein